MIDMDELTGRMAELTGGRASALKSTDGRLRLMLDVGGLSDAVRQEMERAVRAEAALHGLEKVDILMTAERVAQRLIAVASGKGGVGKSTLSANLAVAMRRMGRPVGLVDADISGPSQAMLLANSDKPTATEKKLNPVTGAGDVPFLSMGQLVPDGAAIAWRGPMISNALAQMIDADWGSTSELVVDLPPGTGDIQLSMIQKHRPAGAVIVSTPQDLALIDAKRAISFFEKAGVPIIGLVENMAGYACPHCGEISDPFGKGGAEAAAGELGLTFLGRIPLSLDIRTRSDAGEPPALGDDDAGEAFAKLAGHVGRWLDNQNKEKAHAHQQ